jgi:hypothetical protein
MSNDLNITAVSVGITRAHPLYPRIKNHWMELDIDKTDFLLTLSETGLMVHPAHGTVNMTGEQIWSRVGQACVEFERQNKLHEFVWNLEHDADNIIIVTETDTKDNTIEMMFMDLATQYSIPTVTRNDLKRLQEILKEIENVHFGASDRPV